MIRRETNQKLEAMVMAREQMFGVHSSTNIGSSLIPFHRDVT